MGGPRRLRKGEAKADLIVGEANICRVLGKVGEAKATRENVFGRWMNSAGMKMAKLGGSERSPVYIPRELLWWLRLALLASRSEVWDAFHKRRSRRVGEPVRRGTKLPPNRRSRS
jgi:hypothetical protein